jgi:hypothetical protein
MRRQQDKREACGEAKFRWFSDARQVQTGGHSPKEVDVLRLCNTTSWFEDPAVQSSIFKEKPHLAVNRCYFEIE